MSDLENFVGMLKGAGYEEGSMSPAMPSTNQFRVSHPREGRVEVAIGEDGGVGDGYAGFGGSFYFDKETGKFLGHGLGE